MADRVLEHNMTLVGLEIGYYQDGEGNPVQEAVQALFRMPMAECSEQERMSLPDRGQPCRLTGFGYLDGERKRLPAMRVRMAPALQFGHIPADLGRPQLLYVGLAMLPVGPEFMDGIVRAMRRHLGESWGLRLQYHVPEPVLDGAFNYLGPKVEA